MTAKHPSAEPGPRRTSSAPVRLRASNSTILCALWVGVIVLAVVIDLTK